MRKIVLTLCGIAALAAVSSALAPAGEPQPPLPLNGYQAPIHYGYGYGYGYYANPYAGYDDNAAQPNYGFVHPAYADPSGVMNVAYTRKDEAPPPEAHGPIPAPAPPAVGSVYSMNGYGYGHGYYAGGCNGCNDCQPKHRSCLSKLFGCLFGCRDRHGCGNDCGHGHGCGHDCDDDDCDD